ncbi:hypothetical protein TSUD_143060 [Trifolium subterraneum]|uniref:Uncharacterized protein n=1 Tax=Trifolium subterraneum TaxID=3900 RepID=A0A2Z6NRR3_TRISU|nr:hypothetical protein TSUD_143060 [Trifolium subterraneum]
MNHQKSILSFFHKRTSPENRTSGAAQSSAPSLQQTDRNVKLVVNPPLPADNVRGSRRKYRFGFYQRTSHQP